MQMFNQLKWLPFYFTSIALAQTCDDLPHPMRFGLRHIENKGIGYNTGYTTLEMFLSAPVDRYLVTPFIDLRGHLFDDARWAANAGWGLRAIWGNRIYGLNNYYDYRNSKRKNTYDQISVGFETLGTLWDFRWNAYFPFGTTKSHGYDIQFNSFSGNSLYVTRKFEQALIGTHAELGFCLGTTHDCSFYTAVGPYYFKGPIGTCLWGGQARLKGSYLDYVSAEMSYSYDKKFNGIVQGQVALTLPWGAQKPHKESSCTKSPLLYERMVEPIVKDEIIVLDTDRKKNLAFDPSTNQPYTFWFVNNTNTDASGTFESPYPTLFQGQESSNPGDVIVIFPGDGTTTGLDAGITLQNNQRLWGTAVPHNLPTTLGTVTIPALTDNSYQHTDPTSLLPLGPEITNTGSLDVVTLANNNEISGLYILSQGGNGINGNGITNLTVANNIIQGPTPITEVKNNINLTNPQGTILITENLIFTENAPSSANAGVNIAATDVVNATYNIINNEFPSLENGFVGKYMNCSNVTTTISGNYYNTFGSTKLITFQGGSLNYINCINNMAYCDSGTDSKTISVTLTDANVNALFTKNTIFAPDSEGKEITLNGNSQMNLTITNNYIESWESDLDITINDTSALTCTIFNNDFIFDNGVSGGSGGGISFDTENDGVLSASIANNTIKGVLQGYSDEVVDGINMISNATTSGSSSNTAIISNNALRSGSDGIGINVGGTSTFEATITGNSTNHVQYYGLNLNTIAGATGIWRVDNNSTIAPTFGGVIVANAGTTYLSLTNNFCYPLNYVIQGGSSIPSTPPIPVNTGYAYQLTNTGGGTFYLQSLQGNTGSVGTSGL